MLNTILLTGATGKLGTAIASSQFTGQLLNPTRKDLDLTQPESIRNYFNSNRVNTVIHCAAMARMAECETDPIKALQTNLLGTAFLVQEVARQEKEMHSSIRFIHISTDAVYAGSTGDYSENGPTIPYNKYGWTKLGGECAVHLLTNYCIIRTSFFDLNNTLFEYSASDIYSSKLYIDELVEAIMLLVDHEFIGTINVGSQRDSNYQRYKKFNPDLKPCKNDELFSTHPFKVALNSSLNISQWEKVRNNA